MIIIPHKCDFEYGICIVSDQTVIMTNPPILSCFLSLDEGGWSSWSDYGPCSKSCSYGYQSRSRKCKNPSFDRRVCQGPSMEQQRCNEHVPCPGNFRMLAAAVQPSEGTWTAWGAYSKCSKSCGGGMQSRIRICVNPSHPFGHKTCKGAFRQRRPCNVQHCPVDGGWTSWGQYGSCSKSCGGGVQYKRRKCKNPPPKKGGKHCTGPSTLSRDCNTQTCSVDGHWSPWGQYSQCTKSCGGGSQYRTRICDNPAPSSGGKHCTGPSQQTNVCNTQGCPVDGNWGPWSMFGRCTKTCGGGLKYRNRKCNNPAPASGGKSCQGPSLQAQHCNTQACAIDGHWSPWEQYSQCSKSCGGGSQYRRRTCDNPAPSGGGKQCPGPSQQTNHCNTQACAVDGQWSRWSMYGKCSVTCGGGFKYRSRKCDNPAPASGGKNCRGPSFQSVVCETQACPVNGKWSSWSKYGVCSVTCGGGSQYRSRKCDKPAPANGGKPCVGPSQQSRSCNSQPCKTDANWSKWSKYGPCSKPCGGGSQYRSRKCENPTFAYNARDCVGSNRESRRCNTHPCKVDGHWSSWSRYGRCNRRCGGYQYRSRKCNNPAPANGGADCEGPRRESRRCNSYHCRVDGGWSSWGPYSKCSRTCGSGGRQTRRRTCSHPAPSYGGRPCRGYSHQTRRCGSRVPCEKTCRDERSHGYCKYVLMSYRCGRYYRSCRKTCDACHYYSG
ncbi:coadhesin-like isoform X2 [Orbicella faveolata]|uniref:coadhesin-like isoform X2 n=1 Tax=Orbicella faveolata TaxID=48498 RepID=UPI0009E51170|nr:coadhesin-like isoform X2 [Orbicella faveolata]